MSDTEPMTAPASRRDFVTQLGMGSLALVAAAGCAASPAATQPAATPVPAAPPADRRPGRNAPPVPIPPTTQDGPWDHAWLARLSTARHKLVFDIGAYQNGGGLYYAKNYLNGMRDGWQLASPDVVAILAISGDAYPIIFNDAMWDKHKFGESSKTTDSRTGQLATRNVWWQPRAGESMAEFGVDVLQARGATVLFCNNVFRGVIRRVMSTTQRPYAEVRAELSANMLPGVTVVPAVAAAMAMAQSGGAGYVFAGA